MTHHLTRLPPALRPDQYKTWQVAAPLSTHWRPASCEESGCGAYLNGFLVRVDLSTELGQAQADYIRRRSGREHTETSPGVFQFTPGQSCFREADHRVRVDRPDVFVVRDGDWRVPPQASNPRQLSPENWLDAFRTHQDRLATAANG